MGSVIDMLLRGSNKMPAYLTKEYEDQVKWELVNLNIKRERILSFALILFSTIIIASIFLTNDSLFVEKYLSTKSINIHFMLTTLAALFLILTHSKNKVFKTSINKLYIMHIALVYTVIILCALIAVNNEAINLRPFAYILAMYSIASMIILDAKERYTAYLISYLAYIMGCIYLGGLSSRVLENLVFSIPLLVLALGVSSINYSSYVRNFISQKLIQQKNIELDSMYKRVEEVLEIRTEQLNQALEVDKLRATFFSNISHELRTPLNVIYSAEQMLNVVCRDENIQNSRMEILKYNNMVQQNCYRLIRLIDNLIDITEIDSGQISMNLRKTDIVKLVNEIVSATVEYMKNRKLNLEFTSSIDNKYINCDGDKIGRIILNLLSNAVKFTPEGGYIKVSLYEGEGMVVISVRDTGIGIPEEMKNLVFDPFVQVDKSISRLREGSGVGLTIVKAFVELHNGEISIHSEEGQGSEFIVELPVNLISSTKEHAKMVGVYKSDEKIKMEFSDFYN
jgi:two-component system, OmpR family, phosphate regulon sensor histidine kinase PhoR